MHLINNTINCGGRLLDLSEPCVMGILNITPDSFFDGGKYIEEEQILKQTEKMLSAGACIIDVGAASSRPGAEMLTVEVELKRLLPVITLLKKNFVDIIISVDTFHSAVARKSIEAGAHIINDISAGEMDIEMFNTIAALQVPYIMMHIQGTPKTMQINPQYDDVVMEVMNFFVRKMEQLRASHIHDVILDVGFGFGKTVEHNYKLLNSLKSFEIFGVPIMEGLSRKSMICKVLKVNPENALNGTTALNTIALLNGAKILRVHDVKEAIECIALVKEYSKDNTA
ncbi:MAG: dihydropteroate synthase [Bacteroidia bacterium]